MKLFLCVLLFALSGAVSQAATLLGCGPAIFQPQVALLSSVRHRYERYLTTGCQLQSQTADGQDRWFPALPHISIDKELSSEVSRYPRPAQFQRSYVNLPLRRFQRHLWSVSLLWQHHQWHTQLKHTSYSTALQQRLASGQAMQLQQQQLRLGTELQLADSKPGLSVVGLYYIQAKQPLTVQPRTAAQTDILTPVLYDIIGLGAGSRQLLRGWQHNWQFYIGQGRLRDNGVDGLTSLDLDRTFSYLELQLYSGYRWRLANALYAFSGYQAQLNYYAFNQPAADHPYYIRNSHSISQQLTAQLEWRF